MEFKKGRKLRPSTEQHDTFKSMNAQARNTIQRRDALGPEVAGMFCQSRFDAVSREEQPITPSPSAELSSHSFPSASAFSLTGEFENLR